MSAVTAPPLAPLQVALPGLVPGYFNSREERAKRLAEVRLQQHRLFGYLVRV